VEAAELDVPGVLEGLTEKVVEEAELIVIIIFSVL